MIFLILISVALGAFIGYYLAYNRGKLDGKAQAFSIVWKKIKDIPEVSSLKDELVAELLKDHSKDIKI
jgi:hypothetical protein